jgi:recombination protein RecA
VKLAGSLGNNLLGVGGYPEGRVIEIYCPECWEETTLHRSSKAGGIAAFIDAGTLSLIEIMPKIRR